MGTSAGEILRKDKVGEPLTEKEQAFLDKMRGKIPPSDHELDILREILDQLKQVNEKLDNTTIVNVYK